MKETSASPRAVAAISPLVKIALCLISILALAYSSHAGEPAFGNVPAWKNGSPPPLSLQLWNVPPEPRAAKLLGTGSGLGIDTLGALGLGAFMLARRRQTAR